MNLFVGIFLLQYILIFLGIPTPTLILSIPIVFWSVPYFLSSRWMCSDVHLHLYNLTSTNIFFCVWVSLNISLSCFFCIFQLILCHHVLTSFLFLCKANPVTFFQSDLFSFLSIFLVQFFDKCLNSDKLMLLLYFLKNSASSL